MAITTPNMGLKRWDQPNDIFSYTELSNNFASIDTHDHSSGKGVQIPTGGIANLAVDNTKLATDAVTNTKIAAATIAGDRLVNSTIADTKLASPSNVIYKTLTQDSGPLQGLVAGSLYSNIGGSVATYNILLATGIPVFPLVASHYAVAGKTTKLRLIYAVGTNAVAPAVTLTFGLHNITGTGGTGNNFQTNANTTPVTGSTTVWTTPAANTAATLAGTDFDLPADGRYGLGISSSGSQAAGSVAYVSWILQVRHV